MAKAFDRVWYNFLSIKQKLAGTDATLLAWFKDNISEKYKRVVIKGQCLDCGLTKAGFPQGSVSGPSL